MKKALILSLMVGLVIMPSFAKLKYDENTDTFYSKYASKRVDQDEYDDLATELFEDSSLQGLLSLTADEIIVVFLKLRSMGTLASKRLLHDLKKMTKAAKRDIKHLRHI